jgi:Flp pilus assembly protein TadD
MARWAAGGLILAASAGAGWRRVRAVLLGPGETPPVNAVRLFVGGAAIYLGTFLFAQSWAYRLIFLVWTLPLLGHELRQAAWRRRVWAGTTLVLIGVVCWFVVGTFAVSVRWAHASSFALVFPLVLLGGAAVESQAYPREGRRTRLQGIIFASGGLLIVGTLMIDTGRAALGGNFSSSSMADAWNLMLQGKAAAADGRVPEAISNFEHALQLHPAYADAHAQLGGALWQAGESEEAQLHLEQAISLQPRAIGARNILAGVRRQQRRWDEAIAGYQESLAIRPGDVSTLNQLGLSYLEAGRADDAYQRLEQARRIAPNNETTERNLGLVTAAVGRFHEAADHFARALHLRPDYADAELQWGFMLARAGRLPEALPHFQRAVELAPTSGQAHFVLAMALRELGRTDEGELHFHEAIRLEPDLAPR